MEINTDFPLTLPPDAAFDLLVDLERVTPCLPGAELGDARADGSREVTVQVRLGPMRFTYAGTVRIEEADAGARSAVLVGTATEARGQGDAQARIRMEVQGADAGSHVTARAEVDLTGRAGQMGHGPVQAVAKQLIGQMTQCLESRFGGASPAAATPSAVGPPAPAQATPQAAEPLRGGRLLLRVLLERLRALFRRRRPDS